MVDRIKIENFKCLKNFELDSVKRVNLIGGRNNSGKSTILEALFFFFDRLAADNTLKHFAWRGIHNIELDPEKVWTPLFYNFDTANNIKIKLNKDTMKVAVNTKYMPKQVNNKGNVSLREIGNISNQKNLSLQITVERNNNEIFKSHIALNNGMNNFVDKDNSELVKATYISSRTLNLSNLTEEFSKIDIKGKVHELVEDLKCIDERFESLSLNTLGKEPAIHAKIANVDIKIPAALMGDGINKLLSIILKVMTCQDGVVLIDEIENGFHYSSMPKIWRIINNLSEKYNCQIFATTHSYECLEKACESFKDSPDSFQYIRMAKDKNGEIIPKVFEYETLKSAIENNLEVR
ncbi:MAG: AAA family ATPase [bacterium]